MAGKVAETAVWRPEKGEFLVIDTPALIISVETFSNIQKEAEKISGMEAAILFYEAGKNSGLSWAKRFNKQWKLEESDFIQALEEFYTELGWGKFNIRMNGEQAFIKVENSSFAKVYGESQTSVCHFLRGYAAGIAEAIFGKEMDAEEIKCKAKGDDYCEFLVKPVEKE